MGNCLICQCNGCIFDCGYCNKEDADHDCTRTDCDVLEEE